MKGKKDIYEEYFHPLGPSKSDADECFLDSIARLNKPTVFFQEAKIRQVLKVKLLGNDILSVCDEFDNIYGYVNSIHNSKIVSCLKRFKDFSVEILDKFGEIRIYSI